MLNAKTALVPETWMGKAAQTLLTLWQKKETLVRRNGMFFKALCACVVVLTSTSVAWAQQDDRPQIRVRMQFSGPGQWDPAFLSRAADDFVSTNVFDRLVGYEPGTARLVPILAESWDLSVDGLTYTFDLRQGVQFHGGYGELTAEDVKFSFDRIMDPETGSPFAAAWHGVDEVVVVDPYTVEVRMSQPDATFLASELAYRRGYIVSKHAVEEMGSDFAQRPIGTGPFEFSHRTAADEVIVVSHDDYFQGPPSVRQITFVPISEETVAAAALEVGEMDLIWTRGNPEVANSLAEHPGINTEVVVTTTSRFIGFNQSHEPLADARVRWALAHAIDRSLFEAVTGGLEVAASGPLNVQYGDNVDPNLPEIAYDPERARELLAQAGYPNPNDLRIEFLYSLRSPDPLFADILVEQWRAVGVDVVRDGREHVAYTDQRQSGDYQVTMTGLGRPLEPLIVFRDAFHSDNFPPGSNIGFYTGVDHLIEEARTSFDEDARREIYHRIQQQIVEDMPVLTLTSSANMVAWRAPIATMVHGVNNEFHAYTIEVAP